MRAVLSPLCLLLACTGCASASGTTAAAPAGKGLEVGDGDKVLFSGTASYTVRTGTAGAAERAIAVPGVGELHVGVAGDPHACRLIWSPNVKAADTKASAAKPQGLDRLVVYASDAAGASCAEARRGQLCFAGARFTRPAHAEGEGPASVVVRGCADENDLLWGKIEGSAPATVGPRAMRQRCARVKSPKRSCALTYLRKDFVVVETNPAPDESFSFVWDGDGWRACFLEAEAGAYDVRILVEDTCGGSSTLRLAGDSSELDD